MRRRFFDRVNMDLRNTHLPDGMAADLEAECARYEQLIAASGGIDLQLLGIGLNGLDLGLQERLLVARLPRRGGLGGGRRNVDRLLLGHGRVESLLGGWGHVSFCAFAQSLSLHEAGVRKAAEPSTPTGLT